jgi:hypothetical protein
VCQCPCQFIYCTMYFYVQLSNYIVDSQGSDEVGRELKRPLTWERMGKI